MIRITEREHSMLDVAVSLSEEKWVSLGLDPSLRPKNSTPTTLAGLVISKGVGDFEQDPYVQATLKIRADYEATHAHQEQTD
jgi:hypothetical protein